MNRVRRPVPPKVQELMCACDRGRIVKSTGRCAQCAAELGHQRRRRREAAPVIDDNGQVLLGLGL